MSEHGYKVTEDAMNMDMLVIKGRTFNDDFCPDKNLQQMFINKVSS